MKNKIPHFNYRVFFVNFFKCLLIIFGLTKFDFFRTDKLILLNRFYAQPSDQDSSQLQSSGTKNVEIERFSSTAANSNIPVQACVALVQREDQDDILLYGSDKETSRSILPIKSMRI